MEFKISGQVKVEYLEFQLEFKKKLIEITQVEVQALKDTIAAIKTNGEDSVIHLTAED